MRFTRMGTTAAARGSSTLRIQPQSRLKMLSITTPTAQEKLALRRAPLQQRSSGGFCGKRLSPPQTGVRRPPSTRARAAQPVRASILGVGAPEAVVVGVVALVLFGPKGLAQAAKSLGATLKAFAPTIRELTQVSSELKSTLEEEIGLSDFRDEFQRPTAPLRSASTSSRDEGAGPSRALPGETSSLSELTAGMQEAGESITVDPDIERKREEAARMAWGAPPGQQPSKVEPVLEAMSLQELEAELARRKAATQGVPQKLGTDE